MQIDPILSCLTNIFPYKLNPLLMESNNPFSHTTNLKLHEPGNHPNRNWSSPSHFDQITQHKLLFLLLGRLRETGHINHS